MATEKSCGAVVLKKNKDGIKYLLLHYEAGHWDFPKGHAEKKETEEQTAEREIKEETGIIDLEFISGFKETIKYFFKKGEDTIYKEAVFFIAKTYTESVQISSEHIGYAWMSYDHAHKRLTYKNAKELLEKVDGYLKKSHF